MSMTPVGDWNPEDLTCPNCGVTGTLQIVQRLLAKPIGSHSLAGVQLKTTAIEWPFLMCTVNGCGFQQVAEAPGA